MTSLLLVALVAMTASRALGFVTAGACTCFLSALVMRRLEKQPEEERDYDVMTRGNKQVQTLYKLCI